MLSISKRTQIDMMITSASLCLAGLVVLTTSGRGVDTVDVWRHGIYSQHVQVKDYSGERTASTCTVHDSAGSDWRTRSTDKPTQINVRNFKLNVNCKGNKEQAVASIRICVVHVHRVLVKITLHLAREWSQQGSLLWSLITSSKTSLVFLYLHSTYLLNQIPILKLCPLSLLATR